MQNTLSNVSFGSEKDGFHDETVHFIWAGYEANDHCFRKSGYRAEIIQIFYKVMMEHGIDKPFMITFLWRMRVKCETKEDYETAHYSPCHINTPCQPRAEVRGLGVRVPNLPTVHQNPTTQ